jgi:hypothetical protein
MVGTSWQTDPIFLPHFSQFFPGSPVESGRSVGEVLDMPGSMSGKESKKL